MQNILKEVEKYLIFTIIFLVPLAVLPISPNPFIIPKLAVLSIGVAIVLLVKAIRTIVAGKLELSVGKLDFPVLLIISAYLISAIFKSPNKMEAFLLPGTATLLVSAGLIYFLINQLESGAKKLAAVIFFTSSLLFSLVILLASAGIFANISILPSYIQAKSFSLGGGLLPSAVFLAALVPLGISLLVSEKKLPKKAFFGISLAIVILGLLVVSYNLLPGRPLSPKFPSASVSWSVAIDALKDSPILGVGPGNYLTAFNRFRPISYNATDLWAVKYATANNFYLALLTEAGMLGAAGVILLLVAIYRVFRPRFEKEKITKVKSYDILLAISLVVLLILLAIFPATPLLVFTIFVLLSLNSKATSSTLNLTTEAKGDYKVAQQAVSRFPAFLVTLPIIVIIFIFLFNALRVLRAEYKFKQALEALARNEANTTYQLMIESIRLNPQVDRYRTSISRISLILANAVAGNEEITDTDRTNIARLVQAAIAEGKAAVALNPLRAGSWENLARTYQTIIPFARGADAFAVQTFSQAVSLDPINPNLRIALGGVHYAQGNFDSAIRMFELAAATKPDLANAHYNLAFALRESGSLDRAISEMTVVLSLVDRNSNDYEVARQTLEDMQEKRESEAQASESLTPPTEAEEEVLEPGIELPEEAEPPEPPITPTPTQEESEEEGEVSPTPTGGEEETTPTPTIIP
jgi:tetratricopeptide (TPR) repeat protein